MNSREIFVLVVRIAGLVSLIYTVAGVVMFFGAGFAWFWIVKVLIWAALSVWLLRGAPQLVNFAYGETHLIPEGWTHGTPRAGS